MKTNVIKTICPNCGETDNDEIITYTLIDSIMTTTNKCPKCGHIWTNHYGLYYLGYDNFDLDGLPIRY